MLLFGYHTRKFYAKIVLFTLLISFSLILSKNDMDSGVMDSNSEKLLPGQITRVDWMPEIPSPYVMRDWKQVTEDYDSFVFDFNKTGEFLPLIHWDQSQQNYPQKTFNLPSYVGWVLADEAINCMAAILSATLVGINKSNQNGENWVLMCQNWYNIDTGQYLYLNNRHTITGQTFWYELLPTLIFYQLAYYYPDIGDFQNHSRDIAVRWYDACVAMGGSSEPWITPNFDYTAFDFSKMKPVYNGEWKEPDGAAAVGWLEYMSWLKWKDPRFLTAADWCMSYLDQLDKNPLYEVLLPYGAYTAVRMNAELNRTYDTSKIINWCFNPSGVRSGWGVIASKWGQYDCHGLHGSNTDGGGYAFAMGTFQNVGCLVPIVRYDDRYAHAIGKYVLNAANAARLFYGNGMNAVHQDSEDWIETYDPTYCIAYEGLRREWNDFGPMATGDVNQNRYRDQTGPTNLGLYGSSHVGIFGGIISPTNIEGILQLDCLVTDYYHDQAFPTFLYYNPYSDNKTVEIDVGTSSIDLYDATTNTFLRTKVSGLTSFNLPADTAAVIILVPSDGTLSYDGNKTLLNGIIIDYMKEVYIRPSSTKTPGLESTLGLIGLSILVKGKKRKRKR